MQRCFAASLLSLEGVAVLGRLLGGRAPLNAASERCSHDSVFHRKRGELRHHFLHAPSVVHQLTRRVVHSCFHGRWCTQEPICPATSHSPIRVLPNAKTPRDTKGRLVRRTAVPDTTTKRNAANVRGPAGFGRRRQSRLKHRCAAAAVQAARRQRDRSKKRPQKDAPTVDRRGAADVSPDDRARSPAAEDGQDRRHTH